MEVITFCKRTLLTAVILSPLLFSSSSQSASQGNLGPTSSGSFRITLTIHPKVTAQVASTTQLDTGEVITQARFNEREPICIQGRGINSYRVTASGLSENGAFQLNSQNSQIPYQVELWTGSESAEPMISGLPSNQLETTPFGTECAESEASIAVKLQQQYIQQPLEGALELTISAE